MKQRERVGPADDDAHARAFASLMTRPALDAAYRYATLILGDRADAEDATHDAALRAWRRLDDLRDPSRFDAWFGRILVNACRDRLRMRGRTARRPGVAGDWAQPPARGVSGRHRLTPAGEQASIAEELPAPGADFTTQLARRDALQTALQSLSADHREVVVLRFWADLTVDQIAARTGTTAGTVKSRLHYALRNLRASMGTDENRRNER